MDTPERRVRLRKSVAKLLAMIDEGVPDVVVARECVSVFRHAIVTFEGLATEIFGNWMIRAARVNCSQCVDCGGELPKHRAGQPICCDCETTAQVDVLKQELERGLDAISFDTNNLKEDSA